MGSEVVFIFTHSTSTDHGMTGGAHDPMMEFLVFKTFIATVDHQ